MIHRIECAIFKKPTFCHEFCHPRRSHRLNSAFIRRKEVRHRVQHAERAHAFRVENILTLAA